MSEPIQSASALGHRRFLDEIDARVCRLNGPGVECTPAERLRNCQVFLVAGGSVGIKTAEYLVNLPIGHLTVYPLSQKDVGSFDAPLRQSGRGNWSVFGRAFNIYGASLQLKMHQVLMFAASRPAPRVQRELNETCIRLEMPFVQVSVFAHEIFLGPTVIPGYTACHECYLSRLNANYGRPEVPEARDRFLDKNPDFEFKGQLDVIDRVASALGATELDRLVSGRHTPLALSREVVVNALHQGRQDNTIPYLEWCPACAKSRPAVDDTEFGEFVARAAHWARHASACV
jgi:hypothetical protein